MGPATIGKLIALFERAVGLYASLIHINAYHQPGVEAGKKAAAAVIALQHRILGFLSSNTGKSFTAEQVAEGMGAGEETESVFKILQHLAANPDHNVKCVAGATVFETRYSG